MDSTSMPIAYLDRPTKFLHGIFFIYNLSREKHLSRADVMEVAQPEPALRSITRGLKNVDTVHAYNKRLRQNLELIKKKKMSRLSAIRVNIFVQYSPVRKRDRPYFSD